MLGIQYKQLNNQQTKFNSSVADNPDNMSSEDEKVLQDLYNRSRHGLWALFVYLAASGLAYSYRDQSLATVLPSHIMQMLGPVPPVYMANCVLWLSTFSSLIIIAGRLYNSSSPSSTVTHLLFRIAFFVLFFVSGGLDQYINAIFISGLVVLTLQHHNVLSYYSKKIEGYFNVCDCQ